MPKHIRANFNLYLSKGNLIVFKDGKKKIIREIDESYVYFDGNYKIEKNYLLNQISYIVIDPDDNSKKMEYSTANGYIEETKPIITPKRNIPTFDEYFKDEEIDERENFIKNYNSFKEEMKKYNDELCFYHTTASNNAIQIINARYFYPRMSMNQDNLKFDNRKMNSTTAAVLDGTDDWIEHYVRFYLAPLNGATISMGINYLENGQFPIKFAIDFDSLIKAKTNVFITKCNAYYIPKSFLRFDGLNNLRYMKNWNYLDDIKSSFIEIYKPYDRENKASYSEVLFYEKLSTSFIKYIYFRNENERKLFLSKLGKDEIIEYENKCLVKKEYFYVNNF